MRMLTHGAYEFPIQYGRLLSMDSPSAYIILFILYQQLYT